VRAGGKKERKEEGMKEGRKEGRKGKKERKGKENFFWARGGGGREGGREGMTLR